MTLGGRKIVTLPVGILNNGKSSDEVEIRAMTGVEEDLFSDSDLPIGLRLRRMMGNCIVRIGDVTERKDLEALVPKLSTEDETVLLVALRAISVKNEYSYEVSCPSCGSRLRMDLDLGSLAVKPGEAKKTPVMEVTMPSGMKAKIQPLTLEKASNTEQMILENDSAKMSVAIYRRLVELDGKKEFTLDDVRNMVYGDRLYLREQFEIMEGGLETEFAVVCEKCKRNFTHYLDIARIEFFSPKMS
jgi:hypothetical protein